MKLKAFLAVNTISVVANCSKSSRTCLLSNDIRACLLSNDIRTSLLSNDVRTCLLSNNVLTRSDAPHAMPGLHVDFATMKNIRTTNWYGQRQRWCCACSARQLKLQVSIASILIVESVWPGITATNASYGTTTRINQSIIAMTAVYVV